MLAVQAVLCRDAGIRTFRLAQSAPVGEHMVVVEGNYAVTVQMGQLSRCLGRQPSTQYLHHTFPPNQLIFAAVTHMPTSALKTHLLLVQLSVSEHTGHCAQEVHDITPWNHGGKVLNHLM